MSAAGLCLVPLMLSKAEHTIPSPAPVGQDRDPFTIHVPEVSWRGRLTCHYFLLLRLRCVIVEAFCGENKRMNGCVCSRVNRKLQFCKHVWGLVFRRLLGDRAGIVSRHFGNTDPGRLWFDINVTVFKKVKDMSA